HSQSHTHRQNQSSEDKMKKITTSVGTSVDLPCTFTTKSKPPTTVEWSKDGAIAIVFRHNMELHDEKHSHFEGRTSFDIKDGKPKTFSLRLCSVQHSDAGVYNCKGLWGEDHKEIQEVELLVGTLRRNIERRSLNWKHSVRTTVTHFQSLFLSMTSRLV
uniref:Ig-like domain-containing protein n=1 Tax=Cynoglossus semilaevis TaxID=244447 RepID=A0A3P8V078_CYNSE